jgi:hypothetical protein
MADHNAIAGVSRTLRTLLLDRMVTGASVTLAPPEVTVQGIAAGGRVNLYLCEVLENAGLKNQEIPGTGHPAAYGRPPLSLNLRYLLTTWSGSEDGTESDVNAQILLGDAMRVLHDFSHRIDTLTITNAVAGTLGDPVLDTALADEFERVKITLRPSALNDLTSIWSAIPDANFRRSVMYEATVVQIQTPESRPHPRPVETRRILVTSRRRPHILAAHATPILPTDPVGEMRVRIGEEITIVAEHLLADRLYVRFGGLDPIRVAPTGSGEIRIIIPDDEYPLDLDHPIPPLRAIPAKDQLQPGVLEVRLVAEYSAGGVEGGLDRGTAIAPAVAPRRYPSNTVLLQLVPRITLLNPDHGDKTKMVEIQGTRLWHAGARTAEAIIGDAAVTIRDLGGGNPPPTPTSVLIPMAEAAAALPIPPGPGTDYPIAVEIDGARSRDSVTFKLEP